MPSAAHLLVVLLTVAAVVLSVGLHYEGLNLLARRLAGHGGRQRRRVLYAVIGVLVLLVAEIWIFGLAYWLALKMPGTGEVMGSDGGLLETVYLSAMTFSTVGFGDVAPSGAIRFIAGTEAVLGLFLIAWSATFTYLEMEQHWRRNSR
jgi:hypothetical protein